MTEFDISTPHVFLGLNHARYERRTWIVAGLTAVTMLAEILGGWWFGSMAVIADGLHMATHAAVMLLAAMAYAIARRYALDQRFAFGTGKIGDLTALCSALLLGVVAVVILVESMLRLFYPQAIVYPEAMLLALLGLTVNLVSVVLLHDDDQHQHDHDHNHGEVHVAGHDNNMRAAYVHVLADLGLSLAALVALTVARFSGTRWLDPAVGVVGSMVILNWAYVLVKSAAGILLDLCPDAKLSRRVSEALAGDDATISDFHLWQIGPGHLGLVAAVKGSLTLTDYKARLSGFKTLSHITIEIDR